jgi:hypothetical protein
MGGYAYDEMVRVRFEPKPKTITFWHDDQVLLYTIDLKRCNNAAELLDWILQVNAKDWASPHVVKEMLRCIDEACEESFGNTAQVVFCPGGSLTVVDWEG